MRKTHTGFTLIELLITLAVLAIVIAVGVPSLQRMTETNRGAAQNNLIRGSINAARSEAIKRGVNVIMCESGNSTTAAPTCSGNPDWDSGWILFVDSDSSGNYSGGDSLLGVSAGLTGGLTLRAIDNTNQALSKIIFMPNGGLKLADGSTPSVTFKVCTADADTKKARAINMLPSGLINVAKDTNANSIVNDVTGNDVNCP